MCSRGLKCVKDLDANYFFNITEESQMIQPNETATVRPTYFIPGHHLDIANREGHEMLTLYLLLKHKADQLIGGLINLDIEELADVLFTKPENLIKAIERLDVYGMIYDKETNELLCLDSFHEMFDTYEVVNARYVLDLSEITHSGRINEIFLDFIETTMMK